MRRSTRILVIAGVVAAVGGLLAVQRSLVASEPPGADTATSPEQPPPAQVESYWTPERVRDAEPAPMPEDD